MTLDIYVPAGHPYYNKSICKLTYDHFKLKKDNDEWSTHYFPTWDTIQTEVKDGILINNEEYYQIEFCADIWNRFYVLKSDIQKLKDFCDKRNQKMLYYKESVYEYIDNEILNIAENLLNIAEEDIMMNYRIVCKSHLYYSHIISQIFIKNPYAKAGYRIIDKYIGRYGFFKDTYGLKGKEKKEAEKFNDELFNKFREFSKLIDNFVEIIIEEKKINKNIAKAVAWEAIQRKAVEYYSQKWIEEYEINLENTYDELYNNSNYNSDQIDYNYIEKLLLSDKINISNIQEVLIYFLISKKKDKELILCDHFIKYYELIKEVTKKIDSFDIKQKLKTKQKRKTTKYTINDIDLMTGYEFEEFIALLFKKMGYSPQITKQSGDQGLDVIAIRNETKIGIQVKCYSNTVGNTAIQEAVAGKSFYNCDKALVVTNNYFTNSAIELAQANDVLLWNRDMLKEKIKDLM